MKNTIKLHGCRLYDDVVVVYATACQIPNTVEKWFGFEQTSEEKSYAAQVEAGRWFEISSLGRCIAHVTDDFAERLNDYAATAFIANNISKCKLRAGTGNVAGDCLFDGADLPPID